VKPVLLAFLVWQASNAGLHSSLADPQFFRYQRAITPPAGAGSTCVTIDPRIFPHAAPSLKDLRIYQISPGGQSREVPFAVTLSESVQQDSEPARLMNLGMRGPTIVFDLAMPARPYTEVALDLDGKDFLATATVSGRYEPNAAASTSLGEFTLFDLTSQHLSRSTTLRLQESSFPYLHVELNASPVPGNRAFALTPAMVRGATVPPSRESQSLYTTAAETIVITQRGRETVATFNLPERVPIERVSFALAPDFKSNFSRDVRITGRPTGNPAPSAETITGTIMRVHLTQAGREIRQQQLSIPAILGSNLQSPAIVEVAIQNGDDAPLPITSVRLEMRERKLCFDAPATGPFTLFYGDATLTAPQYDYSRLFSPATPIRIAQLGPELPNPTYHPRPDSRPLTERYPDLLWIVLLIVICALGVVAIHSSKRLPK
jgi:Protein of unknown function (DUF3999)